MFGRYSYALYLVHYPISGAIRDLVLKPLRMPVLLDSSLPAQGLFYLDAGNISLGAAVVSWHLYENGSCVGSGSSRRSPGPARWRVRENVRAKLPSTWRH